MSLSAQDYQKLLSFVGNLYASRTTAELQQVTREGLAALVPGDCYDLVIFSNRQPENDAFFSNPGTYSGEEMRYMLENVGMHPLAAAFQRGDPGAMSISQRIPSRQWHNSEFYRESGYQRLGLKHEIAALLPDASHSGLAAVSVLRAREFSDRDREILNQLRPHLGYLLKLTMTTKRAPSPALIRGIFPMLSEREAEVLFWITEGKQNREIAEILERCLTTVQEHVENIVRKLGLENRHATAVFALRAMMES